MLVAHTTLVLDLPTATLPDKPAVLKVGIIFVLSVVIMVVGFFES